MSKGSYISATDDGFAHQLNTFKNAIGDYVAVLNVTPAQVTSQAADADYFSYALQERELSSNTARQWVSWKDLIRAGGTPPATGMPVAPKALPAPPVVEPGIEPRFRALAKQIKAATDYNLSIGNALGIEGSEQIGPDYTTLAPKISATINGTRVDLDWGWQGYSEFLDQCELQVDRNDGKGFVLLAIDTTPGYTDSQPFPAAPVKWSYQAIYRVGDNRIGQWSAPVTVVVGG